MNVKREQDPIQEKKFTAKDIHQVRKGAGLKRQQQGTSDSNKVYFIFIAIIIMH